MKTMTPIIDAHQHFWEVARGDYGWLKPELGRIYRDYGPADLLPKLKACGIDGTVLVQAAPSIAESEYLLAIADRTPWVLGVVGWIDFEAADALAQIDRLLARVKLCSIRPMIQDLPDDDWMLQPRFSPIFRHLAACDLAFDALIYPRHLPRLLRLLERHPDLRRVIDHCAKPQIAEDRLLPWADDIAQIARHTRAFCKISGPLTEAGADWRAEQLRPYVEHVLAAFGPERCLWGSDWPVLETVARYEDWYQLARDLLSSLDEPARCAVFGGNAMQFYRLSASGGLDGTGSVKGGSPG